MLKCERTFRVRFYVYVHACVHVSNLRKLPNDNSKRTIHQIVRSCPHAHKSVPVSFGQIKASHESSFRRGGGRTGRRSMLV